ncbi:MAG: Asp-tRNA(Asn)/Glu-tRNA(Gln) amidotransferase subunit GatB [Bacteroidia bacterium]|nr:Asp-tRNA(Asn)/Glu-tRNA(Gln) amidotransferase subunit GatB [Bacteroidia bacterium]
MSKESKYEVVIGLEVHAQLLTKSKIYSSDSSEYGAGPNTNVSVISLGHPGTLPKLNKTAVEYAVKMGLACNCQIREYNQFARKNYFYADLPKGYQISQDKTPICHDGYLDVKLESGEHKRIGITRIHLEEDSGKSIHDQDINDSLIDLNRAGVPLIEIVSEPDIRTPEEAYAYLSEIRRLVRYLEICDGNMEEGSLRCDANVSIRPIGQEEFGTKVEVKNMNSITNVKRALHYEIERQTECTLKGEEILQETRSFDASEGTTFVMRAKEMANDYRYFPEPDLPPLRVTKDYRDKIKQNLPPLPKELFEKYTTQFELSEYDADVIIENKDLALYFEEIIKHTKEYKLAANWVMGAVKFYLNENAITIKEFPVKPEQIADLIHLIKDDKVSNTAATQKIFPEMIRTNSNGSSNTPLQIAEQLNLIQEGDEGSIQALIDQAISKYPEKVDEYKSGKKGLIGLFMGEVMKLSGGKADPKKANELLRQKLDN